MSSKLGGGVGVDVVFFVASEHGDARAINLFIAHVIEVVLSRLPQCQQSIRFTARTLPALLVLPRLLKACLGKHNLLDHNTRLIPLALFQAIASFCYIVLQCQHTLRQHLDRILLISKILRLIVRYLLKNYFFFF